MSDAYIFELFLSSICTSMLAHTEQQIKEFILALKCLIYIQVFFIKLWDFMIEIAKECC